MKGSDFVLGFVLDRKSASRRGWRVTGSTKGSKTPKARGRW